MTVDDVMANRSMSCIVCGHADAAPLYSGILRCRRCGHVFADVRLSDAELLELYRRNYFFGDEYSDYIADRRVIQKNFALRLGVLDQFLDARPDKRLLEIGSAYGFFLDLVRDRFSTAVGIDITEDGITYARDTLGLNAVQADFLAHDFGAQQFDVVCLWDTIEHLRDPHLYIEKIGGLLAKQGLVALTTGDIASFNARRMRERWRLLHPPTHLHYFSPDSLRQLFDAHGIEVVYSRHCGFYRSVDNAAYNIFVLRWKRPAVYRALKRLGLARLDFYLNLYDIIYVIGRKR